MSDLIMYIFLFIFCFIFWTLFIKLKGLEHSIYNIVEYIQYDLDYLQAQEKEFKLRLTFDEKDFDSDLREIMRIKHIEGEISGIRRILRLLFFFLPDKFNKKGV